MSEYKNLLSCWHKLEHFSPASLPKGNDVKLINSLPWNEPLVQNDLSKTIEFTIYLGVFDSTIVNDFVQKHFKAEDNDENKTSNNICFASLKIDKNGYYIKDSIGVSTLPWALSQLEKGAIKNDNWSDKFEFLKTEIKNEVNDILNLTKLNGDNHFPEPLKQVSLNELSTIQNTIEAYCGWSIRPEKKIYYKKEEICKSKKETEENNNSTDLLNSFYIKDLEKIISKVETNKAPKAFLDYLNGCLNKKITRIDLSKEINTIRDSLKPKNYPDGCWPSDYSLSLMQQFAVNTIFNNLSDSNQEGMFSVNGPPGTGKTTLLRDIIAPIIVKRAKLLSKIKYPSEAFYDVGQIMINEKLTSCIYAPIKELTNFGIVVASSNNGAVENISKELPLKKEVKPYADNIGYFREVTEKCINVENWGLISAVLGNKQNQSNLINSLWFDNKFDNLKATLQSNKITNNTDWNNIVSEFSFKLKEVSTEKERLETIKQEYIEFIKITLLKDELTEKVKELENKSLVSGEKLRVQKENLSNIKNTKQELLNELTQVKQNKPNVFIYWLNKKIRKEYNKSLQSLLNEYNRIIDKLTKEKEFFEKLELTNKQIISDLNNYSNKLSLCTKQYNVLYGKTQQAKLELKNNYADNEFWKNIDNKSVQESCPWYSDKLKKLQSELFIISLKLNEVFLVNANSKSSMIVTTLIGFFDYLKGNSEQKPDIVKAMWDTFFFVIPVISSTFASIQTMFRGLDKEDIPWLFIDEAGQSIPQAAAGAIWRSKRVVVVGDPLQIEPVVTVPASITNNISKYFELNENNINAELSVQSMADRINPLGSYLNINEQNKWIGIPLRVHRRCLNPMFDISNQIAYANTMVLSTPTNEKINIKFNTSFIQCEGNVEGRHFVKQQAEKIRDLLIDEITHSKNLPDIFIITPFTEISNKLKNFLKTIKIIDNKIWDAWLGSHVGTVHTFQGKQAEGVILCMGLDKNNIGAAIWASKKPNLLNVAITRAKYRFIAIGDKNIWFKQPYFKELRQLKIEECIVENKYIGIT